MLNKPFMHPSEIQMITNHLNPSDTFLEWGSGGSTMYFSKFVKDYYSIEHSKEWFNKIINKVPSNVHLDLVPNDLPRTMPTKKKEFITYINHIDNLPVVKFDKVLIDGRARNHCAEKLIAYLHKDSIIFIHDFWNRKYYHNVFEWYEEVESIKDTEQTLVVLKLKEKFII